MELFKDYVKRVSHITSILQYLHFHLILDLIIKFYNTTNNILVHTKTFLAISNCCFEIVLNKPFIINY